MEGGKFISWLLGDSRLLASLVAPVVYLVPSKFPIRAGKFLLWLSGVSWVISIYTVGWRARKQSGYGCNSLTEDLAASTPCSPFSLIVIIKQNSKNSILLKARKLLQTPTRFLELFSSCIFVCLSLHTSIYFPSLSSF